jgi:hypothetical protein
MTLGEDEKALFSGEMLFTAFKREETFSGC